MVYTLVLGTSEFARASSSLARGTMEKIIVDEINKGKRIDKFLAKEFFSYTRGELIRRIRKGEIFVNGKTVKPSYILEVDDVLEIDFPSEAEKLMANAEIELGIIFENENFVVLNKQAGLQVHPSSNEKTTTLVNALIAKFPEIVGVHDQSKDAELRPGIVQRLDKDTTGVMIVAKNEKTFSELKNLFKDRKVQKTYLAIVYGHLENKKGNIDKPLARALSYKKQIVANGKTKTIVREAVTEYAVSKEFGDYSLLEVKPKTGRMHQIRVHLASLGHPIVGDSVYLPKNMQKNAKEEAKRQLLHAQKIEFELFGEKYAFDAPIPVDFAQFLDNIADGK